MAHDLYEAKKLKTELSLKVLLRLKAQLWLMAQVLFEAEDS